MNFFNIFKKKIRVNGFGVKIIGGDVIIDGRPTPDDARSIFRYLIEEDFLEPGHAYFLTSYGRFGIEMLPVKGECDDDEDDFDYDYEFTR